MTLRIRPATPQDAPALVELRELMFDSMGLTSDNGWQDAARAWFAEHLGEDGVLALVAEDASGVVAGGLATLNRGATPSPANPTGTSVYVANMATRPDARGQGLATRILDGLLDWASANGATSAELHATAQGRPIYERAGFADAACPAMRLRLPRTVERSS